MKKLRHLFFVLGLRWYFIRRWSRGVKMRLLGVKIEPTDPETLQALQQLNTALSSGIVSSHKGESLHVESLEVTMKCVTFEGPRSDPKWWEFWKLWSKKYMTELRAQQERTRIKWRKPT